MALETKRDVRSCPVTSLEPQLRHLPLNDTIDALECILKLNR